MSAMRGQSERKSRNSPASWVMPPFGNGGSMPNWRAISRSVNFGMIMTSKRPRILSVFFFHVIYSYFLAFFFFTLFFPETTSITVDIKNDLLLYRDDIFTDSHTMGTLSEPSLSIAKEKLVVVTGAAVAFQTFVHHRPCQGSGSEGSRSLVSLFSWPYPLPLCS